MNTIHAIECDEEFRVALERNRAASIHSVFPHAVNLVSHGALYSIVARQQYRAPRTLVVPPNIDFSQKGLRPEAAVNLKRGRIILSKDIAIDVSDCETTEAPRVLLRSPDKRAEGLLAFDEAIAALPSQGGCIDIYRNHTHGTQFVLDAIDRAVESRIERFLADMTKGHAHHAATHLIGAGHGLTPSGDDFICGFLSLTGLDENERRMREDLSRFVTQLDLDCRTTAVSSQMLHDSCEGRFPSPQAIAAREFAQGGRGIRKAIEELATIGHTSGLDFASGMAYAARLFNHI